MNDGDPPEPSPPPFDDGSIPPYRVPESAVPKRKPELVQPFQRPPRTFITRTPEQPVQPVSMSHPETVTLPPTQDVVRQPKPIISSTPEPSKILTPIKEKEVTPVQQKPDEKMKPVVQPKPVQKATDPVEKDTKPVQKATGKGKIKKLDEYDGQMGRKHKEHEIEYILDTYLQTGLLPTYVTQKMRWNYKHHRRLPERRELLEREGKRIVVPETTGTTGNIIPMERTNVHNKRVSR